MLIVLMAVQKKCGAALDGKPREVVVIGESFYLITLRPPMM